MSVSTDVNPSPFPADGEMTVVFTDIEGYSLLEKRFGEQLSPLLREHNRLLDALVLQHTGYRSRIIGDAFFIVFERSGDAIRFAVAAQRAFQGRKWTIGEESSGTPVDLLVRIGMHTGRVRVERREGERADFFGDAVNLAARVSSAAHGEQILVSDATRNAWNKTETPEIAFLDLGHHELKGVGKAGLFQITAPGLRHEFPPPHVPFLPNHNVPRARTAFIGRDEDLDALMQGLDAPDAALTTLYGFGGIGKTRLAQEVAGRIVDAPDFKTRWSDGAWWVPLETARDEAAFLSLVADTLPLEARPDLPLASQITAFLRPRRLWLFLDNLEQLESTSVASLIASWLENSPHLHILATSRAPLGLECERVWEVAPLKLNAACALFETRVQARNRQFRLDERQRGDVEAICQRLDGLPLGIELAAAQGSLLSPRQIAVRLEKSWDSLVARDPSRPGRQSALRALIEWSFELLGPDASAVLPQLSVYEGGFTFASAEAVVTCPHGDTWEALFQLRSHSLVRLIHSEQSDAEADSSAPEREARFGLLVPIRHFAEELLLQEGHAAQVRGRHAQFFAAKLEMFERRADAGDELEALHELRAEWANCTSAWQWWREHLVNHDLSQRQAALQYALRWGRVLQARGFWREAHIVVEAALSSWKILEANRQELEDLRIELWLLKASLELDLGNMEAARRAVDYAWDEGHKKGDALWTARTLNLSGMIHLEAELATRSMGESPHCTEAKIEFARALEVCPPDNALWRAKIWHNRGRIEAMQGDFKRARESYKAALLERRRAHDLRGEALTLGNLGVLWQEEGDDERARKAYEESLRLRRQLDEPLGIATMLNNLGELALRRGETQLARDLLEKSRDLFERIGSPLTSVPVETLSTL